MGTGAGEDAEMGAGAGVGAEAGAGMRIALFCVGNRLMLDDGVGPAVYDELAAYDFTGGESTLELFDVGCMTLDQLNAVDAYDLLMTVDAADGTGEPPGTILRFAPSDLAHRGPASQSLHDLRLSDLFDAAALLGYSAEGVCFGMQVENPSPAELTVGLTPKVHEALPRLVEAVLAELVRRGVRVTERASGRMVEPGHRHVMHR